MSVNALTKAFNRLRIFRKDVAIANHSTQAGDVKSVYVTPVLLQVEKPLSRTPTNHVAFSPRTIGLNFDLPRGDMPLKKIIENPLIPNFEIQNPIKTRIEKSDIVTNKVIETPVTANIIEKKAERMIVIRRKKMKKHKKRKWLKKHRAFLERKAQKKFRAKEKIFNAELQAIYQEALAFDAKQYVAERINLLTKERLPNKWRGEKLPESMIRQFMKEKEEKRAYKKRLRTYRLTLD